MTPAGTSRSWAAWACAFLLPLLWPAAGLAAGSANFTRSETVTQGTWTGVYGADGFNVINDTQSYPAYATVTANPAPSASWAPSTTDPRALLKANSIGATWTPHESVRNWATLASSTDGTKLVAGDQTGRLYTSTDSGQSWTARDSNRNWTVVASSADGNKLVAVVDGGQIYTSTDSGVTWTPRETNRRWAGATSSANGVKLVAVDYGGLIYTSADSGLTWTARDSARAWYNVASSADGSTLVAVANSGQIYVSTDSGLNWTPRDSNRNWYCPSISADGTKMMALVNGGQIYISTDTGLTWTPRETNRPWAQAASSADGIKLVATTDGGQIYTSTDAGLTWTAHESGRRWYGLAISADGTKIVAAAIGSQIYTSVADRIAATWYSATSAGAAFSFQIAINDAQLHSLAIYSLDWDYLNRSQTIEIRDTASNALLDLRSITAFAGGNWMVWDIGGTVTVTVTTTNPYLNSVVAGLFFGPATAPGSTAAVLLGQYHLDEPSWNGTAGEVKDSSGNGHHGVVSGSPPPVPATANPALPAATGTCSYATLPGSNVGSGVIDLPGLATSPVPGAKTSVAFWMYWNGNDGAMPIAWGYQALWIAGGGALGYTSYNGDIYGIDANPLANGWHHMVAIFTNNNVAANQIFVDGADQPLLQRYSTPVNSNAVATSTLRIGGASVDGNWRFGGAIDEVQVFSGALTTAEIATIKNATHPCTGPTFQLGRFNAFESATAAGAVTGVIHTKVAALPFTIDVAAIDGTGSLYKYFAGDVKVELLNASDNSGALDANACRASWTAVSGNAGATLTFAGADAGRKSLSLVEAEAWRDLRVRLSTPASGTPTTVACSSDDFANRPTAFANLAATDADSASAGTTRSLGNAAASGGDVHKAGQPFTVRASAINNAGATTANYTGTPAAALSTCSGSACVSSTSSWTKIADEFGTFTFSGTRTVRFGAGSTWTSLVFTGTGLCDNSVFGDPLPNTVKECQVSNLGNLSLTPSAVAGVINRSATYSEAGSFSLQLVDTSFASVDAADGSSAAETTIASTIVTVGRFVPDHFEVSLLTAPVLKTFDSSACAARSFTYLGQPFGYATAPQATVLARNAAGTTTAFYSGALWKLTGASLNQAFTPTPAAPTLDVAAITAPTLTSNSDGTGLLVAAATDKVRFNRPSTAAAPFNADIALAWSVADASENGVAGNGTVATTTPLTFASIGFDAGSQIRFGVLRLLPAYGSELVNLPVQLEAQYWDGVRMATNAADQCTALPTSVAAMGNYQRNLAACETAIAPTTATLVNGRGYLRLAKPGAGNSGSLDLALQLGASAAGLTCASPGGASLATTAANLPWLQGKWNGAAAFDQNPTTRASFGQYRSPLIYRREMY